MFQPHFEVLSSAQKSLWPELAEVPSHFTLYGGTALALRLATVQVGGWGRPLVCRLAGPPARCSDRTRFTEPEAP
jgi:hypothetical protein